MSSSRPSIRAGFGAGKHRRIAASENGEGDSADYRVRKWRAAGGAWEYAARAMELNAAVCDRARIARDARFDGRFFIAVLSTGIYCRPICPSPHARRENVRYFRSAAEAVAAGFRACRRCRPEAAPGTPRWNGTAATVSRALRLIEEGALQEQNLSDLARRLGVSSRQLHRLFAIHLGTSPIAVAKTWRVNFARELLRDTELPMSRVAFTAGFRTVRRFNDAIRAVYGRSPSELRRRPRTARRADEDEYVFRLGYRPPYDWGSLLAFLAERAVEGVEDVGGAAYRRTFTQEGRHGVLQVRHDGRNRALEVRVRCAEPVSLLPIVTRIRGMFDLAADTEVITRHFRGDSVLGPLVRRYPGLRVPGAWDPYEAAVRAALGESISKPADASLRALASRFGEALTIPDAAGLTHVFPDPSALADANLEEWPAERVRTVRALARAALSGENDSLASAAGMGEPAAETIALRAFREPDAFPRDADARLRERSAALTECWRPWRGYAAIYLWRAARDCA
jgi:AraC family transcriptional regulator of adaptative response / DNA-3-methyladenine glycosylase II